MLFNFAFGIKSQPKLQTIQKNISIFDWHILTFFYLLSTKIILIKKLATFWNPIQFQISHAESNTQSRYFSNLRFFFLILLLYFWYVYLLLCLNQNIPYNRITKPKMIDRLPELRKFLGQNADVDSDHGINENQGYQQTVNNEGVDEQFFEDIKTVRQYIAALNKNNYKIQTLKGKYAKAIKSAQEKTTSDEMNQILEQNAAMQKQIKQKINDIKDRVNEAEKNNPDEPETRMKKNFFLSLSKQVTEVLQKEQSYEDQYKQTVKQKVVRQVKFIDKDIDDQKAQQYVENPQLAQQMLQRKIYGQASTTLKNTVSDIEDKFRDIKRLQASVNQCVQLFKQLSVLVFAQGQKIDNIQANVAETKDYIEKGQKKLKQAKEHHKWSKKCKCITIIVGLVVLVIIIVVIATTASKK